VGNWQKKIITRCENGIGYLGDLTILFLRTILWMTIPPFKNERTFQQSKKVGIDSFFIVSLVALFTGMILALQTAYQMQKLSSEIYIANLVAVSIVRELGPVLTALIVAGRVGAAITAEIGTMNVTEQIDALKTLASNPIKYLVVPRFLGLAIMLPILTIYSDIIGIIGGYIICVFKLHIGAAMYIRMSIDSLSVKDIITGLIKTMFFGTIIAMVSCHEGLNVKGGAEGVGKATTFSVVTSFILIIISDCFFTALFYFIFKS
jgi:phospholipid/cholesterol/gamma-HCH transport system permease protein